VVSPRARRRDAGTPGRRDAGTPGRRDAGTPGRRDAGTPGPNDTTEPTTRLAWRSEVTDEELAALTFACGGEARAVAGPGPRPAGLGLRSRGAGRLIGFVDVAWDGGDHTFLLDPTVAPRRRRRGLATWRSSARIAPDTWGTSGCPSTSEDLSGSYLRAFGFRPTRWVSSAALT
jgi:hypothetical protein